MEQLPDNVVDMIYKYKHQLEMRDTMDELTQTRIYCRYLFSLNFVRSAIYLTSDNIIKSCIDLNNLHVESHELLYVLRLRLMYRYNIF